MVDLISVIIPVYNVETYLYDCLESVVNQTYKNLEIILINDGSEDQSGSICNQFQSADSRIKVLHNINGGLSDARNHGIKIATGKFLIFIDSDDIVDIKYIEELHDTLKKENADMSICNYIRFNTKEDIIQDNKNSVPIVFDSRECFLKYFDVKYKSSIVVAWGKLYKKEHWHDIEFPVGKLHEDEFTTYKLIYKADKIAYIDKYLYFYRENPKSITGDKYNIKHLDAIEAFENYIAFFRNKKDKELEDSIMLYYYYFLRNNIKLITQNNGDKDVIKKLKVIRNNLIPKLVLSSYLKLKIKGKLIIYSLTRY